MNPSEELERLDREASAIDAGRLAEVFRFVSFTPGELFGHHSHRRIELNYVKRGSGIMRFGDTEVTIRKGEMICIFPDTGHTFRAGAQGCTLMQLEFLPDVFDRYERLLFGRVGRREPEAGYLKIVNDREIVDTVQMILEELTLDKPYRNMMVVAYYGVLMVHISRHLREAVGFSHANRALRKALEYIGANYAGRIAMTDVAAHAGVSDRYLRRLFTAHVGAPPAEYLAKLRIDKAVELLSRTSEPYSIKEVCYMCGFSTPQYFSKMFRRYVGVTPGKYIKT